MTTSLDDLQQVTNRYGDAWNSHDLHAIMSMHTPDTTFRLHMLGAPPAVGHAAVRDAFAGLLTMWPDIHFATETTWFGRGFLTQQYQLTSTLATPMQLGRLRAEPTGEAITFAGIDVLTVKGGLVHKKETYLDVVAALTQLGAL